MMGYGLPFEDLYGEGLIGLMKACERFKLEKGVRFNTYAVWWIRAQMTEYVLSQASLVKLGTTAAQKKLFFHRRQVYEGTVEEVAKKFCVTVADVEQMRIRLRADVSLNVPVKGIEEEGMEWIDWLADDVPNPEEILEAKQEASDERAKLEIGLATLSERERDVVLGRFSGEEIHGRLARGTGASLESLSAKYGVSRERIRQIEQMALVKIKRALGLAPPARKGGHPRKEDGDSMGLMPVEASGKMNCAGDSGAVGDGPRPNTKPGRGLQPVPTKYCKGCDKTLPRDAFHKTGNRGIAARCRPCDQVRRTADKRKARKLEPHGLTAV